MTPKYCPYCSETRLEELQPTEVAIDNVIWTIYHYECQFCGEIFDRIVPEGELEWEAMDEDDIMESDDYGQGYQH
ncbi:hypothetical protein [Limisalsivibrio acetivorans]|uniref:hypothetical protein n=1 Tax=Limisalsivibrio acetivorans TaxID=1304888 RepID=UPI0003B58916|nr:hypothetical protein [Limisalsivibrio acetivorans]